MQLKICLTILKQVKGFNTASGKHCCNQLKVVSRLGLLNVSIPQAVSTVATCESAKVDDVLTGFNTASGKHCCNLTGILKSLQSKLGKVSIPQAVSTVATKKGSYLNLSG